MELINAGWTTQAVAAACELDLPDRLAAGARATTDLARETGADLDALTRLLRALVTLEVCSEVAADTFALGTLGPLLCHGHEQGLRHWALLNGGLLWTRWGALSAKVRVGRGGATSNDSTERFRRLETDAEEAALFHGAMTELSRRVGGSLNATLTVPDGALVVDVGGGSGELLATVLATRPSIRGLLFDLSPALARALPLLHHHGVAGRCDLRSGSFFDVVPPQGDLYLLKSVLHDWDDECAALLLSRCSEAMKPSARLVVVERTMPERMGTAPEDRAVARSDLNMLVGLAGRERCLSEYRKLFEHAGLALQKAWALSAGFSAIQVTRQHAAG
ncbi:MAG: hypothetical protein IPI03_07585 [Rubrivivax sp.]|nr:hypothetical protein [Rubrivivax sp.]MBK8527183.1 hypothetical protein [Rubrivivax sp.]